MVDNNIYQLQKILKESNTELIFSGTFSQGLIEELGEALKERLRNQQLTKSKISTAFFTFVELAQNIKNYLVLQENEPEYPKIAGSGVITISRTELGYCVNSGNMIFNKNIDKLEDKLNMVLSMDIDTLNCYYKEAIRTEIDKATGKAGLGLVQIARKASRPIEYSFEKVDEKFSFYTLTVTI